MGPRFPGLHDEPAATLIAASLNARVGAAGFIAISYGDHLLSHPDVASAFVGEKPDALDRIDEGGSLHRYYFSLVLLVYHFMAITGASNRVERTFRVEVIGLWGAPLAIFASTLNLCCGNFLLHSMVLTLELFVLQDTKAGWATQFRERTLCPARPKGRYDLGNCRDALIKQDQVLTLDVMVRCTLHVSCHSASEALQHCMWRLRLGHDIRLAAARGRRRQPAWRPFTSGRAECSASAAPAARAL